MRDRSIPRTPVHTGCAPMTWPASEVVIQTRPARPAHRPSPLNRNELTHQSVPLLGRRRREITRAGLPATISRDATFFTTTALAPTTAPLLTVTPGPMKASVPTQT